MAKFSEVLTEGRIGEVRLGMLPETVERYLGCPDDRSVKKQPVEILKFGAIELSFKHVPGTGDSRLVAIAIYFYDPGRKLPASIAFEDWAPAAETTESDFHRFLDLAGVKVHSEGDGEGTHLVLESGASVTFVDGRLHSVHVRRRDKAAVRKQMSVSLSDSTFTKLRAQAERENVSLQELIERMLSSAL